MSDLTKKIIKKLRHYYRKIHTKHVVLDVGELFFQNNRGGRFLRYDMILRLISVEKYYKDPHYDFNLYYRMQDARMGKGWADKSVDVFKKLIESYKNNGYDENSEITLDKNLNLIDGSHRMALAFFHGCKTISAKVLPEIYDIYYQIEWFRINDFSEDECAMLKGKYIELYSLYEKPFVCTLWHPAKSYWDNITENLKLFGDIIEMKDFCFTPNEYKFYTYGIYHVDDIEKWKIDKKLSVMHVDDTDKLYLRMVALNINDPNFRLKAKTNKTLSRKGELIKGLIRNAYKGKIHNYFHDVIIHIGDNFYQNDYIYKLLSTPAIDVSSILDEISPYKYVITKFNVDYMPSDFPQKYPLGKDIDIICSDRDNYIAIKQTIEKASVKYKDSYSIRSVTKTNNSDGEYRTLIRFELEHYLVLQFDIAYRTGKTKHGFESAMVSDRVANKNFYTTSPSFEILIRLCEIHDYPHKKHHLDYINKHKEDIKPDLCDKYLNFNWRKIISNEDSKNHS